MAKLPITTRRSINLLLDHAANHLNIGDPLPTEVRMTEIVASSRTAVRSALAYLAEHGLIAGMKQRHLLRKPRPNDYFDVAELHSATEKLQQVLMERIYERDLPPGAEFTEVELSRAAGVSTIAVREFLIGFSRNGLIEKNPLAHTASLADVMENLGTHRRTVVDARAPDRFRGENETIDPVGGHIPGAKNRFFKDNLLPDGRFKPGPQLKQEFAPLFSNAGTAIMQCGSGVTACHNLLAMEVAGLHGASLYPGSWSEWCANPARPVATAA
eukprot:gene34150-42108_t